MILFILWQYSPSVSLHRENYMHLLMFFKVLLLSNVKMKAFIFSFLMGLKLNRSLCYKWFNIRNIFWFKRVFMNIGSNYFDNSNNLAPYSCGENGLLLKSTNSWSLLVNNICQVKWNLKDYFFCVMLSL